MLNCVLKEVVGNQYCITSFISLPNNVSVRILAENNYVIWLILFFHLALYTVYKELPRLCTITSCSLHFMSSEKITDCVK